MARMTPRGKGRPPIRQEYQLRIAELVEKGLTNEDIYRMIKEEASRRGRTDFPELPTVKVHAARQRARAREERWNDQPFHWPDSILGVLREERSADGAAQRISVSAARAVPPQASEAALELISLYRPRWWSDREQRPTNRQVRWFWYVLSAAPDVNRDLALELSSYLSTAEFAQDRHGRGYEEDRDIAAIEFLLASCPWRSAEHTQRYLDRADPEEQVGILAVLADRHGGGSRGLMEDRIESWGIEPRFIDAIVDAWGGEFMTRDEDMSGEDDASDDPEQDEE
jgi:hypothetical protein